MYSLGFPFRGRGNGGANKEVPKVGKVPLCRKFSTMLAGAYIQTVVLYFVSYYHNVERLGGFP